MTNEQLFEKAYAFALQQTEKFINPSKFNLDTGIKYAEELAKSIGADPVLSKIGAALMDIKLGECIKNKCAPKHVELGVKLAEEFLNENKVDSKTKQILLDCVKCHHGIASGNYPSKEAEVCANADCYRFLLPAGVYYGVILTTNSWGMTQNQSIDYVLSKVEEKHSILSLDKAKADLEPHYNAIKTILNSCRN